MIQCGTWDTGEEVQITYPKEQRVLYKKKIRVVFTTSLKDKWVSIKAIS
jgi:hypothetical protein